MGKWLFGGVLAAGMVAGSAVPEAVGGDFSLSIGGFGPAYGYYAPPPPVYYAPAPVYRPAVVVPHYGHYDVYPAYGPSFYGHFHHRGHGHWGGRRHHHYGHHHHH